MKFVLTSIIYHHASIIHAIVIVYLGPACNMTIHYIHKKISYNFAICIGTARHLKTKKKNMN